MPPPYYEAPHHGGYHGSSKTFTMKPEIKLFPELKDDGKFPQWQRSFRTVCHATNIGEVLDPNYVPAPQDWVSYRNKSMWLYNVLYRTVSTVDGRNILYAHQATLDGRAAYLALCQHATTSTSAQLHSRTLMAKLVTIRISSSWQAPYVKFISDYVLMLNTYNERVGDADERLTEAQMRTLLEAAVSTAKPLYEVTRSELLDLAKGNPRFTLAQYIDLLYSSAAVMDAERKTTGRTRAANMHFGTTGSDGSETPSEGEQDIQAFIAELKAYAAKREDGDDTSGLRVDDDTWVKLQVDSRRKWATIPREDKEMILKALAPATRAVLNANVADTSQGEDEVEEQDEETSDGEATGELQANVTSGEKGKIHPAALARMMASKKKPAIKKAGETRSANTVTWKVNTHESVAASSERDSEVPFLNDLENWGVPSQGSDELDTFGDSKEEEDDDPFNLKALMDGGDDVDFW